MAFPVGFVFENRVFSLTKRICYGNLSKVTNRPRQPAAGNRISPAEVTRATIEQSIQLFVCNPSVLYGRKDFLVSNCKEVKQPDGKYPEH